MEIVAEATMSQKCVNRNMMRAPLGSSRKGGKRNQRMSVVSPKFRASRTTWECHARRRAGDRDVGSPAWGYRSGAPRLVLL